MKLNCYKFNWRADEFPEMKFDTDIQVGLVAQEVEKLFPELVKTDENGFKAISYDKLSVLLLQGIKEQQTEIETAKTENQLIRSLLDSLREELDQLKSLVMVTGNR
jgi:hypothetical protein